jgi:hypothetical protein
LYYRGFPEPEMDVLGSFRFPIARGTRYDERKDRVCQEGNNRENETGKSPNTNASLVNYTSNVERRGVITGRK